MPVWDIVLVVLLMILNGVFAMSELAMMSARRVRLEHMAEEGDKGAAAAVRLIDEPTRFLSTVQIGITLVGIFAGAYGGATFAGPLAATLAAAGVEEWSYPVAVAIVVAAITYLSLVVGELVPKRIALNNAERIAATVARPMTVISTVGAPLVWLLQRSTEALLRLLRVPEKPDSSVTEEDVKRLIAEGTQSGVFEAAERDMIEGVLQLADRSVPNVMTQRSEVIWLDIADAPEAIQAEINASGHSRYPVSRGALDEFEGIVHAKDLLDQMMRTGSLDLGACLRQPLVVHESTPVLKLLELFRQTPVHMAVVIDEYGAVEGIVTPTDILTAIAGELPETSENPDDEAVRRDDGSWLMDGRITIDRTERLLGQKDMRGDDDYVTLAGFVLAQLGRIPATGEQFAWRDLRFEVMDMDGRRIDKILVSEAPKEDAEVT